MSVQENGQQVQTETVKSQETLTQQPEQDIHEFIDDFMEAAIPRSPVSREMRQAQRQEEQVVEEPVVTESAPSEPTAEQAEIARLTKELENSKKSYNHLQSTVDGRISASTKGLREQVEGLTAKMEDFMLRSSRSQDGYDSRFEEEQTPRANVTEQDVRRAVEEALSKDERVQRGQTLSDLVEFRASYPDSNKYDLFSQVILEKFPELKSSRGVKGAMVGLYEVARKFEELHVELAKAQEEAAKAQKVDPQSKQEAETKVQVDRSRIGGEKANLLIDRSRRMGNETGVTATPNPRERVNYREPFDKQVDGVVQRVMRDLGQ